MGYVVALGALGVFLIICLLCVAVLVVVGIGIIVAALWG